MNFLLLWSVREDFGVQSPPTFIYTLNSVCCNAGELLRLDVVVTGSRVEDVYWLKDGVKIEPSIGHKMLQDGKQHTLLILEANPNDTGKYDCVAVNQHGKTICSGKVEVRQSHLQVSSIQRPTLKVEEKLPTPMTTDSKQMSALSKEKAPQVLQHLEPVNVREGETASFRCRIANVKSKFVFALNLRHTLIDIV